MMSRRAAVIAMLVAVALGCWSAPGVADDPDAGAQWEQVEPDSQSSGPQSSPDSRSQHVPPELCANLGAAISQLVVLRDRGIPRERVLNGVNLAGANSKAQEYVIGYIDFIYDHPEMGPEEVKAQVESGCARPPH